jgi:hypothetical protein
MRKDRVKVVIEDIRRIPTIGKGPIRNPIYITKEQYSLLKLLGYNVIVCEEEKMETFKVEEVVENVITKEPVEEVVEEPKEEEVTTKEPVEEIVTEEVEVEEPVVQETIEEPVEEVVEEPKEEEVTTKEPTLDVEKLTKKELKAELDKRKVKYAYNSNVDQLKDLLKDNL